MDDYDDTEVIDSEGNGLGKVERTYVDDAGNARFVAVKTGTILHKHHLVPVDGLDQQNDGLHIPFTSDVVKDSPSIDPGDTLEGEMLDTVRSYYTGTVTPTADSAGEEDDEEEDGAAGEDSLSSSGVPAAVPIATEEAPEGLTQVRDRGDVVEIPIVEEVLVKKPVVREVLRVRKDRVGETDTVTADLRREDIQVESTGDEGLVNDRTGSGNS